MKQILLTIALIVISFPAFADNVVIAPSGSGDVVRELPGNATIVTGGSGGTVTIRGDDDVWERVLLGPRTRVYAPNYGRDNGGYNATCPPTLSTSDRNRCIRDYIKLQDKYN